MSSQELVTWAKAAGIVDSCGFVPFQEDIARVYRSLNVVVHASTKPEPFGRSIVEAMACARPVIVCDAGGASELFEHGENALGFPPGDCAALAHAMGELLEEPLRDRLGEVAHTHATAHFGRARLAAELLAIYTPKPTSAVAPRG